MATVSFKTSKSKDGKLRKDEEKIEKLNTEKELHLGKIEAARNFFKKAWWRNTCNNFSFAVSSFAPKLYNHWSMFLLKKTLWYCNFNIHCLNKLLLHFGWDYCETRQWWNSSFDWYYLKKIKIRTEKLLHYLDNCIAQNKN